jgi:hypothetical protein
MGFPFQTSIQNLIGKAAAPLHDFVFDAQATGQDRHELLWDCYLSGQMDDAALEHEITTDPAFGKFIEALNQHH